MDSVDLDDLEPQIFVGWHPPYIFSCAAKVSIVVPSVTTQC